MNYFEDCLLGLAVIVEGIKITPQRNGLLVHTAHTIINGFNYLAAKDEAVRVVENVYSRTSAEAPFRIGDWIALIARAEFCSPAANFYIGHAKKAHKPGG